MACRCPPCADPRMAGNGRLGNLKTCLRISATRPITVDAPQSPYSTISKSGFAAHHRFKWHFLADWVLKINKKIQAHNHCEKKLKVERRGKRPWGHPGTGRARPPRCLVRWQCDSPRSLITSRRSAGRDLGRNSAVSPAVSQPFLRPRPFPTQMNENLGF